ncbi:glycosyltransferase [Methylocystis parvus]|uniref:Glycosyltransferase family 4 protein n=1 Tax=Methylocystis parvus TaxID=134 RepID=A0A6B8LY09_9HYPH|nr:glycosyltransferase [Methylocystis parvus]QGM97317.1 glycosyltransferase family 4 protein [Methylocystis parvus]WBJ98772.1 glycosyltransferase [Methylocystis parvus OBBP]
MSAICAGTGGRPHSGVAPRVAFFHQNDVFQTQGGIERYVATIFDGAPERVVLVSAGKSRDSARIFDVDMKPTGGVPRWIGYLLAVFAERRAIATFLRENNVQTLEFSRPEYIFAGLLFPGKRAVTIHGTGPGPGNRLHWLLHHGCCLLLPFLADRVQIVGRDPSGVPRIARWLLGARIAYFDAWYDESFAPAPLPPLEAAAPLRVFYGGRIAPQKNPKLLFDIIREASRTTPNAFEFHYFGSDFEAFGREGLDDLVIDHGFLGPRALADAMRSCHLGLMCSAFGEGSPYVVVEGLACGRPYILPTLPTLRAAYDGYEGVYFVERYEAQHYLAAMARVRALMLAGGVDPSKIAAQMTARARSRAVPKLVDELSDLARGVVEREPAGC